MEKGVWQSWVRHEARFGRTFKFTTPGQLLAHFLTPALSIDDDDDELGSLVKIWLAGLTLEARKACTSPPPHHRTPTTPLAIPKQIPDIMITTLNITTMAVEIPTT